MTYLLTLLVSTFGFALGNAAAGEQMVCPGETVRGHAAVVRYATGQVRGTRHPDVPIVSEGQIRLLVDWNPSDRYYCENLTRVVQQYRKDGAGFAGYHVTYYTDGVVLYGVAVPTSPVVTRTGPNTMNVDLRYIPVFVTRFNFEVLTVAGL